MPNDFWLCKDYVTSAYCKIVYVNLRFSPNLKIIVGRVEA
jgi:hypothetical protein